jgi:engulfment/cell motility protein 1
MAFDSDGGLYSYPGSTDTSTMSKKDKPNYSKDYRKLGFKNEVNPVQDFATTPPGILALDCM